MHVGIFSSERNLVVIFPIGCVGRYAWLFCNMNMAVILLTIRLHGTIFAYSMPVTLLCDTDSAAILVVILLYEVVSVGITLLG